MARLPVRLALVSLATLVVAILVTSCSVFWPKPTYSAPVGWGGSVWHKDAFDSEYETSIDLRDDGTAWMGNAPTGTWRQTDDGICWDYTGDYYTGEAKWRGYSDQGIEVDFADSRMIYWAEPGKFGSYTWRSMKLVSCDGNVVLFLDLTHGDATN